MTKDQKLAFIPAFYARFQVNELEQAQQDLALAAGYYRNGFEFATTAARYMGQKWVPSIMLRLPIGGFDFKKRHRKLLRVNQGIFTHTIRPFTASTDKELIWQKFKSQVHKWQFIPRLEHHLFRDRNPTSYHTMELSIYDGSRLVAFTAFDQGKKSLSSLEAAYDPEYSRFSLGFYSMLLEIEHCRALHFDYYYPGFLPKDDAMFAYKLRPGTMEFLRLYTGDWLPYGQMEDSDWLMEKVLSKNEELKKQLQTKGLLVIYGFGHCLYAPTKKASIQSSNLVLIVPIQVALGTALLFVFWDEILGAYRAFEGEELFPELQHNPKDFHFFYHVRQKNYLGQFSLASDVLLLINEFATYSQP